jgi:hypothetical protein
VIKNFSMLAWQWGKDYGRRVSFQALNRVRAGGARMNIETLATAICAKT